MASIVSENEMFFNQFEPKTQNRFIMTVDGMPSFIIRAASRPQFQQDAKVLPHINIERYIHGKGRWQPINITLYDPVSPSAAQMVMEWIRLGHESITGRDGYADFYKKDIIFNALGPVGDRVEEWIGKGSFITSANFGDFDWNNDEAVTIQCTIQADYWILSY